MTHWRKTCTTSWVGGGEFLDGRGGEKGGGLQFSQLLICNYDMCGSSKNCETSPTSLFLCKRKEEETIYNFFAVGIYQLYIFCHNNNIQYNIRLNQAASFC